HPARLGEAGDVGVVEPDVAALGGGLADAEAGRAGHHGVDDVRALGDAGAGDAVVLPPGAGVGDLVDDVALGDGGPGAGQVEAREVLHGEVELAVGEAPHDGGEADDAARDALDDAAHAPAPPDLPVVL